MSHYWPTFRVIMGWLLAGWLIFGVGHAVADSRETADAQTLSKATVAVADLPPEARETLALIKHGGPFPYRKDGTTFGNRERRLPIRAKGYYREYTVPTPEASDRGARRIIAGARNEFYYTADHYNSFKRILE
jgi:ribonuclease T1